MDCCLQLASHNGLRTFYLLIAAFFNILSIYQLNFTSQQIPILGRKYPFSHR